MISTLCNIIIWISLIIGVCMTFNLIFELYITVTDAEPQDVVNKINKFIDNMDDHIEFYFNKFFNNNFCK